MITRQKIEFYFFFGFFALVTIFAIFVFLPFLDELFLAGVLAIILYSFYEHLCRLCGNREKIAAILTIFISLIFIITPLTFLGFQIFNETKNVYLDLQLNNNEYIANITNSLEASVHQYFPDVSLDWTGYVKQGLNWLAHNLGVLLSNTVQILFSIFLIAISLFFFLKDGKKFKNILLELSPFEKKYNEKIFQQVSIVIHSVIKGALFIGVIQGILVGIGFTIFHIPNAILWGTIAAFASLLPGIGTGLIVLPALIYLLINGNIPSAIGFAIWGGVVVGLVDNILMPYVYGKGTQLHPLIILFSVLGGLAMFGLVGFLFGPVIVSLFLAMIDIYRMYIAKPK